MKEILCKIPEKYKKELTNGKKFIYALQAGKLLENKMNICMQA